MKKASSSRTSRTDWKRVKSMKDRDIKLTPEHPELDIKDIARVIVRKGLKPVEEKKPKATDRVAQVRSIAGMLSHLRRRPGLTDDEAVLRAVAADDARIRAYARKRRRK